MYRIYIYYSIYTWTAAYSCPFLTFTTWCDLSNMAPGCPRLVTVESLKASGSSAKPVGTSVDHPPNQPEWSTGWCFQPLWKIWKSVGMIIPNINIYIYGEKTCSKPPISQPWMINLKTSSITLDAKLKSTPSPTMRPCFLQRTGIRPTGGWKIYTPSPVPSHTNLRGLYECTLEIFLALDSSQSLWKPGSIG